MNPHSPDELVQLWWEIHDLEQHAHQNDALPGGSPPAWVDWRDRFAWTRDLETPGATGAQWQLYRGATTLQPGEFHAPAGFHVVGAWSDEPYRIVWLCVPERIILTYCEGDLDYLACDTGDILREVMGGLNTFYRNLRQ